jgi:hypothetical protein
MVATMAVAVALATCSTGHDGAAKQPSGAQQPSTICAALTARDIEGVASRPVLKQTDLARAPGTDINCATVWFDQSAQIILELSEADRGRADLAALRDEIVPLVRPSEVQPLPALGPGAFVARRVLGFLQGDKLVTLRAGYTADGKLQLTTDQLVRIATIVRSRGR